MKLPRKRFIISAILTSFCVLSFWSYRAYLRFRLPPEASEYRIVYQCKRHSITRLQVWRLSEKQVVHDRRLLKIAHQLAERDLAYDLHNAQRLGRNPSESFDKEFLVSLYGNENSEEVEKIGYSFVVE